MDITSATRLAGVFGWPVSHSLSPQMHNAALREAGLPFVYLAFPVRPDDLRRALAGAGALGMVGVNLTIPHKVAAVPLMSRISEAARALGAVNTVRMDADGLYGDNTDAIGFAEAMRGDGVDLRGMRAVVYGAGGAARAVVYALLLEDAEITIINRTPEKACVLVRDLTGVVPSARPVQVVAPGSAEECAAVQACELLVNATSMGMSPDVGTTPLSRADLLHPNMTVVDLVYRPRTTRLLREAARAGCRCFNGVSMLVHQGAQSFRIWFGRDPDTAVMRRAVERALEAEESTDHTAKDAVAGMIAV